MLSHGCRTACDFVCCLSLCTLCGKSCKKSRILGRCCLTAHDFIHHCICLAICEVFFVYDFYYGLFYHDYVLLYSGNFLFTIRIFFLFVILILTRPSIYQSAVNVLINHVVIKLLSICFPSGVMIDSG